MSKAQHKFSMLSIKDLIDARDQYHLHLMNKRNVIATAIGRYLIRKTDPWPKSNKIPDVKSGNKEPRDLENSEVRYYSWPCILVFVDQWVKQNEFVTESSKSNDGSKATISDMVPPTLFLPDGREVPVCVVLAHKNESPKGAIDFQNLVFPKNIIGGGYPVIASVQGQDNLASIGCLVTDGHRTYALTNRHVSGEPGETLYTFFEDEKVPIGKSSKKQLTRESFCDIFDKWSGEDVYCNLDIGLIDIDDINSWTAQIYGIGPLGRLVDLSDHNISLDLIGCKVKAFGCASRQMKGEVLGLFYRYKAMGGYEYMADFLIGKRRGKYAPDFFTNHGDSGTVWMLEDSNRPIAVQWGGHEFLDGAKKVKSQYALATCLSTVCNLLEVDLVRDLNIGLESYWGGMGHYTIGNMACNLVQNPKLQQLMLANRKLISFEQGDITDKNMKGLSGKTFVPLADVADLVWKMGITKRGNEGPNHFADMDKPNSEGKNLIQLCDNPENICVDAWKAYYDDVKDESRGLLPFRVWQIYNAMVDYLKQGKAPEFVCAAGILAHYVGDCTNPMHISYMYDGNPGDTVKALKKVKKGGKEELVEVDEPRAKGIHSAYENDVLKYHMSEILYALNDLIAKNAPTENFKGGNAAAVAMVNLMKTIYETLTPRELIDVYNTLDKKQRRIAADILWDNFGKQTIKILYEASRNLALLWDSAWEEGDGDNKINNAGEIPQEVLKALYIDKTFLPSHTLNKIGPALN